MRIAVEAAQGDVSADGFRGTCVALSEQLGGEPDFVVIQQTEHEELARLEQSISQAFPDAAIIGATSCAGVITHKGLFGFAGKPGYGVLGLRDGDGAYGVGLCCTEKDPSVAALRALEDALDNADRPGETPDLVWVHSTPGCEEPTVAALAKALGDQTPIVGGSAADNSVRGNWRIFSATASSKSGVVVAVLFPGTPVGHSFQSGYAPTAQLGVATAVEGRILKEIDGRPAAHVYNDWSGGLLSEALANPNITANPQTFTAPLGIRVGEVSNDSGVGVPYYNLIHPQRPVADGGLQLFTGVSEGDSLELMRGSSTSIVKRAPGVVDDALDAADIERPDLAGALAIFCASFMVAVGPDLPAMAASVRDRLGGAPFLGIFSFGEVGTFLGGECRHGNLMMSQTIFSKAPS